MVVASPASASDDTQVWTGVFVSGPVKGQLGVWVEGQLRITDEASRLGQRNLRIGAGWEPSRDFSLYGGYAVFRNLPDNGVATTEHRVWQQGIATIIGSPRIRLFSRTRLEQRWRENQNGTSLRVREMIRANVPLGKPDAPSFVVSSEVFGELQDTSWGTRRGFDQIRNFAGISVPLRPKMALELGYMNQAPLAKGRAGPNDIGMATLVARF